MECDKRSVIVLLIEDDAGHRLLIKESLRAGGIVNEIVEVENGQEALDYLSRRSKYEDPARSPRPGLILLDVNLPKVNGFGVLEQIKADPVLRFIPVIMLTSTDSQTEINRSYQLGASSYIVKPVSFEGFQDRVKKLGLFLDIVRLPQ